MLWCCGSTEPADRIPLLHSPTPFYSHDTAVLTSHFSVCPLWNSGFFSLHSQRWCWGWLSSDQRFSSQNLTVASYIKSYKDLSGPKLDHSFYCYNYFFTAWCNTYIRIMYTHIFNFLFYSRRMNKTKYTFSAFFSPSSCVGFRYQTISDT